MTREPTASEGRGPVTPGSHGWKKGSGGLSLSWLLQEHPFPCPRRMGPNTTEIRTASSLPHTPQSDPSLMVPTATPPISEKGHWTGTHSEDRPLGLGNLRKGRGRRGPGCSTGEPCRCPPPPAHPRSRDKSPPRPLQGACGTQGEGPGATGITRSPSSWCPRAAAARAAWVAPRPPRCTSWTKWPPPAPRLSLCHCPLWPHPSPHPSEISPAPPDPTLPTRSTLTPPQPPPPKGPGFWLCPPGPHARNTHKVPVAAERVPSDISPPHRPRQREGSACRAPAASWGELQGSPPHRRRASWNVASTVSA